MEEWMYLMGKAYLELITQNSIVDVPLGSKYTCKYNNNFFPDVSKSKLMTFGKNFSMINVSYQYLPDTKAYLDPSRTSTMGILLQNVFLQNCRSLSSKFTERKESHPGVFWWILRDTKIQLFCRKPSGNCFCSTQKSFTNKIEENPLRKEKNRDSL